MVGGCSPPPPSGAEFLEAPKPAEKIFDGPKAQKEIWPNHLRRLGGGGWWVGPGGRGWVVGVGPPPAPPPPVVPSR